MASIGMHGSLSGCFPGWRENELVVFMEGLSSQLVRGRFIAIDEIAADAIFVN
jgi:hypothetical protein